MSSGRYILRNGGLFLKLACVIAAALSAACTAVPMEGRLDAPADVAVNIVIEETEGYDAAAPTLVPMGRLINTIHYMYELPDDGAEKKVANGDYYIMGFNKETEKVKYRNVAEFASEPSVSMRDFEAYVPEMTKEEVDALLGTDRLDFNPAYKYLHSPDLLYVAVNRQTLRDADGQAGGEPIDIMLAPKNYTQSLSFEFTLDVEEGVEVALEDIDAEVSGFTGKVQMMTGKIDRENLGRAVLPLELVDETASAVDGKNMITTRYRGELLTFGLFANINAAEISGAGILKISMVARRDLGDGTKEEKVLHAALNLQNTIESAGLTAELEDKSGYRIVRNEASLVVASPLKIRNWEIVENGGQGIDYWVKDEIPIDVEI